MTWMSLSEMPAARNCSARSLATRGTSPRLWTLGISIACLKTSRVFTCQLCGSLVGSVRGSVAATAAVENKASNSAADRRMKSSEDELRDATRRADTVKPLPHGLRKDIRRCAFLLTD